MLPPWMIPPSSTKQLPEKELRIPFYAPELPEACPWDEPKKETLEERGSVIIDFTI